MAATTTLLGLVTPTQGTLSGTWGDTVNYGISDYIDIAVAGTLSFAGDGAITLANTTGSAAGNSIGSTTAQYMVIRITGTQTVVKVITGPSYSKLYMVDHAGATSAVTFKASGQTGVSVAVGEKVFVYFNGTDYVKVAPYFVNGVLPVANGGTGLTSGTSGGVLAYTATGTLASSAALTQYGVVIGGGAGVAPTSTAAGTAGYVLTANASAAPTFQAVAAQVYPGAGIANSTGTAWGTSYTTSGSGTVVALATSPTFVTPLLGTPTSGTLSNCTVDGTDAVGFRNIPINSQSAAYTAVLADSGKVIFHPSTDANARTYTIPAAASVAYPLGTAITFINLTSQVVTIAITTDTMYLSSAGTTGSRSLAQYGSATAIKVAGLSSAGIWLISGSGLT